MKNFLKWGCKTFMRLPEKIRFLLAGGFNTAVGYVLFVLFYFILKNLLHYQIILFLSYLPTTIVSFLTFKFFVFCTKGKWKREYLRVVMSSGIVYMVNIISLYLLIEVFGKPLQSFLSAFLVYVTKWLENFAWAKGVEVYVLIAQLVSISVMTVVSYLMNKYFSFQVHLKKEA